MLKKLKTALLIIAGAAGLVLLADACHYLGVAHAAAAAESPPAAQPVGFDLMGLAALVLAGLTGVSLVIAAFALVLHKVAPLTKTKWDDNAAVTLDHWKAFVVEIRDLLSGLVPGASGAGATTIVAASVTTTDDRPTIAMPPLGRDPQAGRVSAGLLAGLGLGSAAFGAIVGLVAVLLASCHPEPGTKTAAIEHGLWDCTAPERAQAVDAMKPLADSAIEKIRKPDGTLDTVAFKALYSKANLLSDATSLLLCALTTTLAAILLPSNIAHAAGPPPELVELRAQFEAIRAAQFPGVAIKTSAGTI